MNDEMDLMTKRDPRDVLDGAWVYVSGCMEREGIQVEHITAMTVIDRAYQAVAYSRWPGVERPN